MEQVQYVKCEPCMGRGYKPKPWSHSSPRYGQGFNAVTCRSCDGRGYKVVEQPANNT